MASFIKSKLKAARDAIGKKDYKGAEAAATQVLEYEPSNYNATVFLALAYLELGDQTKSLQTYIKATELNPEQALAWQGLSKLYERTEKWDEYAATLRHLTDLFGKQGDVMKCADALQKYIETHRSHGSRDQVIEALSLLLPSSSLYTTLSMLPEPTPTAPASTTTYDIQLAIYNSLPTFEEIVALTERVEEERIKKEVERRRMRLGAPRPEQIKNEVAREVWDASELPSLYNEILNHPNTGDELRRSTESKLLRRKLQHLESLPLLDESMIAKQKLLSEIEDLSNGVVLLGIPDELAWMFFLDSKDVYSIEEYGFLTLRQFTEVFASLHLSKVIRGYFDYMHISYDEEEITNDESPGEVFEDADPFTSVLDAASKLPNCILAQRIVSELYRLEGDHENAIKVAESGLRRVAKAEASYGKSLSRVKLAFQTVLAVSLVKYFPPKHHARASTILSEVFSQDPENIPSLIAQGSIFQHKYEWTNAEAIFQTVARLNPDHETKLMAWGERAWCIVQQTERIHEGINELKSVLETLDREEGKPEEKARAWWRLGKSLWDSGEKEQAYKHFVTALKRSPTFAPAFTSLGVYYADHVSPPDIDRSSKCFQKAFELDAREGEAARRLAEGFAEEREWDLVEVVARRTIEGEGGLEGGISNKDKVVSSRYLPTNAWAWKAVGVVELSRRNYPSAIQSFQIALRADGEDSVSWQRLGESYARSGRHAASIKALKKALDLHPDDWMSLYLLGDVYRLMGQYSSSIEVFEDVLKHHPDEMCVLSALAETHLSHARSQTVEGFHSRAEISAVASISVALELLDKGQGFRRVIWKTAADAAYELSQLESFDDTEAVKGALISLSSLIAASESITYIKEIIDLPLVIESNVSGYTALQVAVAAYDHIISLDSLDVSAAAATYFDAGLALNRLSAQIKDQDKSSTALKQAKDLIQRALTIDPYNDVYWNTMGNLNFVDNAKLSQHAYIKALECDAKSALTWTNLGLLYLFHGDLELANEALYRAQTLDPDYVLAWIGQGLVATMNGHHTDSHALFEHAVNISAEVPEADIEFSKRAFERLAEVVGPKSTAQADLLLLPFHALDRYCRRRPTDTAALHLFAMICERLNQTDLALDLVEKCIALLERSYEETEDVATEQQFALANGTLGRLRLATGNFFGAIEAFSSSLSLLSTDSNDTRTSTMRAHAHFGSGLAHFNNGELEAALQMFEGSLSELSPEMVNVRGHVAVLLAQTLWALGSDEARDSARGQLLECISNDPENVTAMTALVAMGILDSDDSLVDAALSEIQGLTLDKRGELDPGRIVPALLIQHHLALNRKKDALAVAQRAVHTQPLHDAFRRVLALLLLQLTEINAASAVIAGNRDVFSDTLDDNMRISAIAATIKGSDQAVVLSQKSVFVAPWKTDNWKALAYARASKGA
ncbi:TPR-like protein [Hysterangium stoloniferum]|nr:TPR-like protein [Hysterangium stoloniferum]